MRTLTKDTQQENLNVKTPFSGFQDRFWAFQRDICVL